MNIFTKKRKRPNIKREIESILDEMSYLSKDSAEYAQMASQLKLLYDLDDKKKDRGVKWDTIAVVAGNLLGIIIIVGYERASVLTSKALAFIIKGRV